MLGARSGSWGGQLSKCVHLQGSSSLSKQLVRNLAEQDRRAGQAELQPSTSGADGRLCSKRPAPRGTVHDAKARWTGAHEALLAGSVVASKPVLGIKWVALGLCCSMLTRNRGKPKLRPDLILLPVPSALRFSFQTRTLGKC